MIKIDNNFDEVVKDGMSIVDFYADWCGPCKMFGPVFESTEKKHKNINFCKINVDNDGEVAQKLGVMSIPTTIMFKDGKELRRNIGLMNEAELEAFIGEE